MPVYDSSPSQKTYQAFKERFSTVERVLKIFVPLCFALDYAHKKGVIHRDVKPANIVLTECDETNDKFTAKIVDFGIAKQEGDGQSLTRTGEVFGTPLYMSPEQCCGVKVDNRSDIYSLGCVIYEALTGMPPFRSDNALQAMMQHRTKLPLLKEATLGIEFPPVLESAMSKMLAKDPEERYQSCEQLARDLIGLQNPALARFQPSNPPSNSAGYRPFIKPSTAAEGRPIRRQWVAPIAVALFVVLIITGILLLLFNEPKTGTIASEKHSSDSSIVKSITTANIDEAFLAKSATDDAKLFGMLKNRTVGPSLKLVLTNYGLSAFKTYSESAQVVEDLDLSDYSTITDDVGQIKSLTELNLYNNPGITDKGISELKELRLDNLYLKGTTLDGSVFKSPGNLKTIQALNVDYTKIRRNIAALLSLRLQELRIDNDQLIDTDLTVIGRMSTLEHLYMENNPQITDRGLLKLKDLPKLQILSVRKTGVSSQGGQNLKGLDRVLNCTR